MPLEDACLHLDSNQMRVFFFFSFFLQIWYYEGLISFRAAFDAAVLIDSVGSSAFPVYTLLHRCVCVCVCVCV